MLVQELPHLNLQVIDQNASTMIVEMPVSSLQHVLNWCNQHVEGGWESIRTWRIDFLVEQVNDDIHIVSRLFVPCLTNSKCDGQ